MPGLVFLGTPNFAVPCLQKLLECNAGVRLVITQPDRPSGRGRKICESPVKTLANEAGIPIYQPERIRGGEVIEKIRAYGAECAVVVAFGQLVPQSFLDIFLLGTLNVHGSLLPRYRGAAPIQRAILAGETLTGISIMLLDAGMDTGPVLAQKEVSIGPEDTFGTVYKTLAEHGAKLLIDTLRDWTAGRLAPLVQDDALATCAPPIHKEELRIDWNSPAKDIINKVRAFDPAPGAWFALGGKRVKCFRAASFPWAATGASGEVVGMADCGLIVAGGCGQSLCIGDLQLEGLRRMRACEFTCGRPIPRGSFLE
ncbi:MAG: methionyl-tRNA formyltransferase [Syntrophobacteraceae bacterium]